jgi:hypothetical protein
MCLPWTGIEDMKRVYAHYLQWEDYQHGMYRQTMLAGDPERVTDSAALLSSVDALQAAMTRVVIEWPVATEVNLTHSAINQQAWLGQAACCLMFGAPEYLTKQAWHLLTEPLQTAANAVADRVIAEWQTRYSPGPVPQSCPVCLIPESRLLPKLQKTPCP